MISSTTFSNPTTDHVQNAQLAVATAPFLYAAQHSHPQFTPQTSSTPTSYATLLSHHLVRPPTPQTLPFTQTISNNITDLQQSSSKPFVTPIVNGINNDPSKTTQVNDLIPSGTLSTKNSPTTTLNNIWSYTTAGSPLNLTQTAQTAAATAVAAMGLLNNENSQNTEIANEILKEILTTPTKQHKYEISLLSLL